MAGDPVHEENGLWYFWTECYEERFGPYTSEQECRTKLDEYCVNMLGYNKED